LETEPAGTLKNLLIKRARLIGSARNKLVALRKIMESRRHITHALFYCGDGSVEDEDSGYSLRDVERVCMLLGNELGIVVNTYTAETPMENRVELRNALASGSIQGLVAIRCLDEGVDIPQVRTAFILASSSNPRQFIQRRGRVLRPYPGKEQAYIYDFIVMPAESSIGYLDTERQLLSRELQRCVEFANLALNAGEVKGSLVDIQKRDGLLSIT